MAVKTYDIGKRKWKHGEKLPGSWHRLLGPCPVCGQACFDYGGGWRCQNSWCMNSANNPIGNLGPPPTWWNTDINVFLEGLLWIATRDGFVDIQENCAGFGKSPREAVEDLLANERSAANETKPDSCEK